MEGSSDHASCFNYSAVKTSFTDFFVGKVVFLTITNLSFSSSVAIWYLFVFYISVFRISAYSWRKKTSASIAEKLFINFYSFLSSLKKDNS